MPRQRKFASYFTERPDPPAGLEVIEIGSRSVRLLWKRAFDGNSPIRDYVIQYRSLPSHDKTDDWNPVKTHNVTYTPGSSAGSNSIHPTQNGLFHMFHESMSRAAFLPPFRISLSLFLIILFLSLFLVSRFRAGLSFETTSDDQEMALVSGLHPAVTYIFRIFAINGIDASGPTEHVIAKTQEEGR